MKIPNFIDTVVVDKEGRLTNEFKQILIQLFTQLGINLSDEGFKIPEQTSANISLLNNINSKNRLIVDSDTNQLKINLNGTFKTITTS